MEAPTTLYAVQDVGAEVTMLLVNARTPLEALDAYCDKSGVARYTDTLELAMDGDEDAQAQWDGLVYELPPRGYTAAVHSNYEIMAVPVHTPFEVSGPSPNGYAVYDANEICVTDGHLSPDVALAYVAAAPTFDREDRTEETAEKIRAYARYEEEASA